VKDKSKQISVSFSNSSQSSIVACLHLFAKIHKIAISCRPVYLFVRWPDDFPMKYLSNLTHVILKDISLPQLQFKGLPKVQKLELLGYDFASFETVNPTNSLTFLRIHQFHFSGLLPSSVENISTVEIAGHFKQLPRFGNHKRFSFIGNTKTNFSLLNQMSQPYFYGNLQHLTLDCQFSSNVTDLSFVQNITEIHLLHRGNTGHNCLVPVLTSTVIRLIGFNLRLWDNQILPNAKRLRLVGCCGIETLPAMPSIQRLGLFENNQAFLKEVPSYATLRKLVIKNCRDIHKIGEYPE
jgi:hypothetical protein